MDPDLNPKPDPELIANNFGSAGSGCTTTIMDPEQLLTQPTQFHDE
jgi:hypothetical protein